MNELITLTKVKLSPVSAEFEDMPFEEWLEKGRSLLAVQECANFYIGDWIEHGAKRFGEHTDATTGKQVRGEHAGKYREALAQLDRSYGTLRNAAYVARSIPVSLRNDKLTWSHHLEVAHVKDCKQRRQWLKLAANGSGDRMTVVQLREAIRAAESKYSSDDKEPRPKLLAEWVKPVKDIGRVVAYMDEWTEQTRADFVVEMKPIVQAYLRAGGTIEPPKERTVNPSE